MATLTIRNLPDHVRDRLRIRAAHNGRSMEAEARLILEESLVEPGSVDLSWVEAIIELGNEFGGIELDIPPREVEPAWTFDEP
ncbi:FitA-like ribbon-helix-helix domain-containing protein [Tsukamurella tyrosinosolvens]|uniref:FitA-like ribbon-helix-helix domain-containing protein n=1 Tax=Tsukamurella tyrosinosolvens TaxID=57704 RepID=UPI002DD41FF4|nr:Arc family DNA-binding protein [Tsukamurella tyrosinosolvens]MEC4613577.1 Arc family DNA-binding protein [Tsukamurella tyrosinosolvens]